MLLYRKRWPGKFYENNIYFLHVHSHRICGESKAKSIFCSSRQWCIYVKRQRKTEEKTGVIPIGKLGEISWWNLIIWVSEWRTWKEIPLLVVIDVLPEENFHTGCWSISPSQDFIHPDIRILLRWSLFFTNNDTLLVTNTWNKQRVLFTTHSLWCS